VTAQTFGKLTLWLRNPKKAKAVSTEPLRKTNIVVEEALKKTLTAKPIRKTKVVMAEALRKTNALKEIGFQNFKEK